MKKKLILPKLLFLFLVVFTMLFCVFAVPVGTAEEEMNLEATEATESIEITIFSETVETEEAEVEEILPTVVTEPKVIEETEPVKNTYTDSAAAQEARDNPEFLAKLLFAEAGGTSWEGQVYTCSAILNLCDHRGSTIWEAGHQVNTFAVAPYVDSRVPTETQYEVIDYVLNGGRIPEICYFRTDYYHSFGTPVIEVGGHYFSKP